MNSRVTTSHQRTKICISIQNFYTNFRREKTSRLEVDCTVAIRKSYKSLEQISRGSIFGKGIDPIVTYTYIYESVCINENGNGTSYGKANTALERSPGNIHIPFTYACDMYVLLHKSLFRTMSRYYHQSAEYVDKYKRKKILEAVNLQELKQWNFTKSDEIPNSLRYV